jgi:hypothetical protein
MAATRTGVSLQFMAGSAGMQGFGLHFPRGTPGLPSAHQNLHEADFPISPAIINVIPRTMTRAAALVLSLSLAPLACAAPRQISGIYPHLAMFNNEGECGTGAVVPWADRLWVVTYAPHQPNGSSDKLYEITPDLQQIIRPESIGGTPANRMIHAESQQLFIGPYTIDAQRGVRTIPYSTMFGRHTGMARHLTDPAGKIVYATMEEGFYEVDVTSLAVKNLWVDEQLRKGGTAMKAVTETMEGRAADLPGYHGKGFYSSQGRYIYANNGEHGPDALRNPKAASGVLAEWDGKADQWTVVRRNQFTEVTGPGGITGGKPNDPVWSVGWDHKSLLLMLRDGGKWHTFRLPKASSSYDGAHGWNTEWPRIREVGDGPLLMTMHGMFWEFPRTFSAAHTAGIRPISSYIKVIGDFCAWQDQIVFGCDDSAKSEFLNKRKAKGRIAPPQSQSNLWFMKRAALTELGPTLSQGAVWLQEDVKAGEASDPFLFGGLSGGTSNYGLYLAVDGEKPTTIAIERDDSGSGKWTKWFTVTLNAAAGQWINFDWLNFRRTNDGGWEYHYWPSETGKGRGRGKATRDGVVDEQPPSPPVWIRLRSDQPLPKATALFTGGPARRPSDAESQSVFEGLATVSSDLTLAATVRARAENKGTLHCMPADGSALYELDADLKLQRVDDPAALAYHKANCAIPAGVLTVDAASITYTDDSGRRWRLPKGEPAFDKDGAAGPARVCREVCTERDLFNAGGTFYELPAENAGGFAKVRPVCTHNRRIHDYCSWRGLLIMTGVAADAPPGEHIIRSDDGKAAVWAGAVDDLWKFPRPTGTGGPWLDSAIKAGVPSDPCLIWGFARRELNVSHHSAGPVNFTVELDLTGDGLWVPWKTIAVPAGGTVLHVLPPEVQARWLRITPSHDCTASAVLSH